MFKEHHLIECFQQFRRKCFFSEDATCISQVNGQLQSIIVRFNQAFLVIT